MICVFSTILSPALPPLSRSLCSNMLMTHTFTFILSQPSRVKSTILELECLIALQAWSSRNSLSLNPERRIRLCSLRHSTTLSLFISDVRLPHIDIAGSVVPFALFSASHSTNEISRAYFNHLYVHCDIFDQPSPQLVANMVDCRFSYTNAVCITIYYRPGPILRHRKIAFGVFKTHWLDVSSTGSISNALL